jgi:hypothetical protein
MVAKTATGLFVSWRLRDSLLHQLRVYGLVYDYEIVEDRRSLESRITIVGAPKIVAAVKKCAMEWCQDVIDQEARADAAEERREQLARIARRERRQAFFRKFKLW